MFGFEIAVRADRKRRVRLLLISSDPALHPALPGHHIKSVLIRRVDNLGDNVLVLPVVREIGRHHPDAVVTVMARPQFWALYNGYAHEFMRPRAVSHLRSQLKRYDLVYNIECSFPDGYDPATAVASGAVRHIGVSAWNKHLYRGLLDGLALHGYAPTGRGPRIHLTDEIRSEARSWLAERTSRRDRPLLVAVNPSCGFRPKQWPLKDLIRVCRWLIREFDAHLILLGHDPDDPDVLRMVRDLPGDKCHGLTGERIELVAAVLSCLDIHLAGDSGTGHVAAAVGLSTVSIFGPTSSNVWRPAGRKAIIVQHPADCLACGYEGVKSCGSRSCLNRIKPTQVADGILLCISKCACQAPTSQKVRTDLRVEFAVQSDPADACVFWCGALNRAGSTGRCASVFWECERPIGD